MHSQTSLLSDADREQIAAAEITARIANAIDSAAQKRSGDAPITLTGCGDGFRQEPRYLLRICPCPEHSISRSSTISPIGPQGRLLIVLRTGLTIFLACKTMVSPFASIASSATFWWLRDYDRALALAAEQRKPMLLLFQEVPGCSTCVRFGQDVLTHPLMVELIADRLVSVAIFNNHPGADAEILRRYDEPSWNNPVVRFLGPDGAELLPKLADRYDALGLHEKITAVLEMLGDDVPGYFRSLGRDLLVEYGLSKRVTYTTPCFWSGETSLAQHQLAITTDAGWVDGEEVVQVHFEPREVSRTDLDFYARAEGFQPDRKRRFRA